MYTVSNNKLFKDEAYYIFAMGFSCKGPSAFGLHLGTSLFPPATWPRINHWTRHKGCKRKTNRCGHLCGWLGKPCSPFSPGWIWWLNILWRVLILGAEIWSIFSEIGLHSGCNPFFFSGGPYFPNEKDPMESTCPKFGGPFIFSPILHPWKKHPKHPKHEMHLTEFRCNYPRR